MDNNNLYRIADGLRKQVAHLENIFEIIYTVHSKRSHQGIQRTLGAINRTYNGITLEMVSTFLKYCQVCHLKQSQKTQPRLKPIKSNKVFERIQIDLIGMRNKPEGDYKWIAHVVDHFLTISRVVGSA